MTLVCTSRAPLEKLEAYKRRMGWEFEWVSSEGGDYSYDFGASFTPEQQRDGAELSYFGWVEDPARSAAS